MKRFFHRGIVAARGAGVDPAASKHLLAGSESGV